MITHGNFFSGSGTWELAAKLCGATTLWASEIEPFPVALEAKRFPEAKQLGDITKVSGYDIDPVDIMSNSSPCQSISVAGKRHGMAQGSGTRSSLFHEVIRITKEMREKDADEQLRMRGTVEYIRPRIWLWENVPGALSSNDGEDFRCVLEEIARIVEPEVSIPRPKKWANAGSVDGNGWSIAWCIRNAANEGVPQRRRRIFLVADFGGHRAGEILFKSESLSWYHEEVRCSWEMLTYSIAYRIAKAGEYINGRIQSVSDRSEEIWLPIRGYEGLYEVSDRGRVKSLEKETAHWRGGTITRKELILLDHDDGYGYRRIDLHKNGERKSYFVHDLVADAFLKKIEGCNQVNHIDENKCNNDVSNLEYCDAKYNVNYGTSIQRRSEKRKIPVIATDKDGNETYFDSAIDAELQGYAFSQDIAKCCKDKRSTANGYSWRYADEKH